jgi:hypothetical protein
MNEPVQNNGYKVSSKVQEFLAVFLAITITLFTIGLIIYGIASGSVTFSGSIDVSLVTGIIIVTALMAILRTVFGKSNVS